MQRRAEATVVSLQTVENVKKKSTLLVSYLRNEFWTCNDR